jgi:multicomponent Na+:H+ antiporter subunit C
VSPFAVYALAGVALVSIGLHGVVVRVHLLRKLLALNVTGGGVFLLLVAVARRGEGPPDPVPHAMVLTGIVVAVSVTAFALALLRRIHAATGRARLPEEELE